jgi:hypothetical protein
MSRLSWLAAAVVVAAVTVAVVLAARPGTTPDPGNAPSPADPAQHRVSPGAPVSDDRLRSAKPMPKGG